MRKTFRGIPTVWENVKTESGLDMSLDVTGSAIEASKCLPANRRVAFIRAEIISAMHGEKDTFVKSALLALDDRLK